ncbi:MAG: hydroxyacylglutathione hydrolase [Mariprofundales bacterium]|nr:hydroxyacylglutathione hydrolase [Mariprofundales bacterium]
MASGPFIYNHELFTVYQLPVLRDNYIYIIANNRSRESLIIDPASAEVVINTCSELNLTPVTILNTHHHWDHTDGNSELVQQYQIPVIAAGEKSAHISSSPAATMQMIGVNITTITLPGHTLDHVAYYINGALFCGDTLFGAGCGRIFEGSAMQMWQSLCKLAQLPAESSLYSAHEYTIANLRFARQVDPDNTLLEQRCKQDRQRRRQGIPTIPSTIGMECATNPFLRPLNPQFCTRYAQQNGIDNDAATVFAHLRRRKDQS